MTNLDSSWLVSTCFDGGDLRQMRLIIHYTPLRPEAMVRDQS